MQRDVEIACHNHTADDAVRKETQQKAIQRLSIALGCLLFVMAGEFVGGGIANSLAVLTDAAHLMGDAVGYGVAILAVVWAGSPPSTRNAYGLQRAEVVGALIAVGLVWVMCALLLMAAVKRMVHPVATGGPVMLITASVGFAFNICMMFILSHPYESVTGGDACCPAPSALDPGAKNEQAEEAAPSLWQSLVDYVKGQPASSGGEAGSRKSLVDTNLNVRAMFVHVVSDTITSFGAVVAAVIITVKPSWHRVDPIATIFFTVIASLAPIPLVMEVLDLVMLKAPDDCDVAAMQTDLAEVKGVIDVHCLHCFKLVANKPIVEVHLLVTKQCNRDLVVSRALRAIQQHAGKHVHATIQTSSNKHFCDRTRAMGVAGSTTTAGPFRLSSMAAASFAGGSTPMPFAMPKPPSGPGPSSYGATDTDGHADARSSDEEGGECGEGPEAPTS